jgi:hypothetical protein
MTVAAPSPSAAVQLLAGTEVMRDRIGIKTPRLEQEIRRLTLEAAETVLPALEVAAARERGSRLTITEATALAQEALALR